MWLTISLYITGELWGCKKKSVETIEGKYNVLNDFTIEAGPFQANLYGYSTSGTSTITISNLYFGTSLVPNYGQLPTLTVDQVGGKV